MCVENYRFLPIKNEMTVTIKNTKNNIFAISVAPEAMPPNPNTAATIAMIKNTTV